MQGEWTVDGRDGNNVKALFKMLKGQLLAYALTGVICRVMLCLKAELSQTSSCLVRCKIVCALEISP